MGLGLKVSLRVLNGLMSILGGSWVGISMVRSSLIWVITIVALLITPLITTHEPPSIERGQVSMSPVAGCPRLRKARNPRSEDPSETTHGPYLSGS